MADNIERDTRTDEYIDSMHYDGLVSIAGIDIQASRILFTLDPIAYRQIQAELEDMEEEEEEEEEDD